MSDDERASILSHEERALAAHLTDEPEASSEEIADATGRSKDSVVKGIDRIRSKTHRAVATMLQSPFTTDAVAELTPDERQALVSIVTAADSSEE